MASGLCRAWSHQGDAESFGVKAAEGHQLIDGGLCGGFGGPFVVVVVTSQVVGVSTPAVRRQNLDFVGGHEINAME